MCLQPPITVLQSKAAPVREHSCVLKVGSIYFKIGMRTGLETKQYIAQSLMCSLSFFTFFLILPFSSPAFLNLSSFHLPPLSMPVMLSVNRRLLTHVT